jgi:hypothetical protein
MELSSDSAIEFSRPKPVGTELRSKLPASFGEFGFEETAGGCAHATDNDAGSSGHSELFSRIERITSDQEGTEEIL